MVMINKDGSIRDHGHQHHILPHHHRDFLLHMIPPSRNEHDSIPGLCKDKKGAIMIILLTMILIVITVIIITHN